MSNKIKDTGEIILRLNSLVYSYPGSNSLILNEMSAQITNLVYEDRHKPLGQVVGILGPSGVGKSTAFSLIAGISKPNSGDILVGTEKKELQAIEVGDIGVVYQKYYLIEHMTVQENLKIAAQHLAKETQQSKIEEMMNFFGLSEHSHKYPAELSGGQQQRVSIAQQVLCSSGLILMDEPFSGLDYLNKKRACQLISQVANSNDKNTVVVVTHDIYTAVAICDHIWLMGVRPDKNGSYIHMTYDLVGMGLAYQDNIKELPLYAKVVRDIENLYEGLATGDYK